MKSLVLAVAAAGCGFEAPPFQDNPIDARPDARDSDVPPEGIQPGTPLHLLISEVQTNQNSEFIEIYNPSEDPIDLTNYYLSDTREYWKLPGLVAGNEVLAPSPSDYLLRFPTGTSIPAHGVQTIAVNAPEFFIEFASRATYSMAFPDGVATPMIQMAAINLSTQLTNAGEFAVVFYWDGTSDLVKDVDLVVYGAAPQNGPGNTPALKGSVDGPDADLVKSAYATDRLINGDFPADALDDTSYKRTKLEGTSEVHDGTGNGIDGDDETSETMTMNWEGPISVPTPGMVTLP
ncbi:MAG: lamin tail domain-containing protein [Kofleriaceae bacterium]